MDGNKLYIVDASVLIKWFVKEIEDRAQALKLRDDYLSGKIRLAMPTSCLYELFNTVARKVPAAALLILSQIIMFGIEEFRLTIENSMLGITIMQKYPHVSFYDSVHHAIAIQNNGTFVTADKKYYDETKTFKHIKLLKDY